MVLSAMTSANSPETLNPAEHAALEAGAERADSPLRYALDRIVAERGSAYIPFFALGDPDLAASVSVVGAMIEAGADIVEIGIPFSDPTADGPVLQRAYVRALAHRDVTTENCLAALEGLHARYPTTPFVILCYFNLIHHFGLAAFVDRARRAGVLGLVVPDLPYDSPEGLELSRLGLAAGIDPIYMITPQTAPARLAAMSRLARGFYYYVSSYGVTGGRKELDADLGARVAAVRAAGRLPVAVGFGIGSPEQARQVAGFADAVIVGSANHGLVEAALAEQGSAGAAAIAAACVEKLSAYTAAMKSATAEGGRPRRFSPT